jgi:7-keto-8-aminopelargonate synthetase-like enzyme
MREEPEHREKVLENARYMREMLDALGLDYWNSPTPAIPIVLGDKNKCYSVWKSLWEQGFFTVMSVSPGVPVGKDLIRCAVSSAHTHEQIDRFGEALKKAVAKSGLPFQLKL